MTRLVGFFLLQLAAALYARERISENLQKTDALRDYCDMLEQFRGLLESDGAPMPALFALLSERSSGEAGAFVMLLSHEMDKLGEHHFQNIWQRALTENANCLDKETKRELEALGTVLGRYDHTTQLNAIDTCREHLRRRLEDRQRTENQDKRVTLALSISSSLLVGIILI